MCGVIVVDVESFGLLVADVMPIYMIMPRFSHNYALFYQLLDSNLFTHRNIIGKGVIQYFFTCAGTLPSMGGSILHRTSSLADAISLSYKGFS